MAFECVARDRRVRGSSLAIALLAASPLAFALHSARSFATGATVTAELPGVETRVARQRVQGRVLSQDGAALPGVRLSVMYPHERAPGERLVSDSLGRFSFRPRAIEFRIHAEHSHEGAVETAILRSDSKVAERGPLVLVLVKPPTLSGRVVDLRGDPIAHAELRLAPQALDEDASRERRSPRVPSRWISTDERGTFTTSVPVTGIYSLTAWARGFAAREIAFSITGDEGSVRVSLAPHASPRGVVRDVNGRAIEGAYVVACAGEAAVTLESSIDGTFEFGPNAVGCAVVAHHRNYAHSRAARLEARKLNELRLERGGTIEGIVTDESGRPVTNARIEVSSFSPSEDEAPLDALPGERSLPVRREFRFEALAPGTYDLIATRDLSDEGGEVSTASSSTLVVTRGAVVRGVHIVIGGERP